MSNFEDHLKHDLQASVPLREPSRDLVSAGIKHGRHFARRAVGRRWAARGAVVLFVTAAVVLPLTLNASGPSAPSRKTTTMLTPPTTSTVPAPAGKAAVRAFVARASRAQSSTYAATYRLNWSNGAEEKQVDAQTASALRYTVTRVGTPAVTFIWDRASGRSENCTQSTGSAHWTCQSPSSGNGLSLLVEQYEPKALFDALTEAVDQGGTFTLGSRTVHGRPLRCLLLGNPAAPTSTWCITGDGEFGYWSSSVSWPQTGAGTAVLEALTTRVAADELVPPATR